MDRGAAAAGAEGDGRGSGVRRFHVAQRDDASQRVIAALQNLYRKKLRPVEEAFSFGRFHYDAITDTELEAKSQVLVIGQYSTGKTTFIRHLLGTDFPNMNIGPEPTTDKFTVVIHGEDDRPVEGTSLALIKELPYEGLTRFGTGLLNKLDAAISTSPFLENMTLIDTPGVLSGEMQKHQRSYSFAEVARWFADRSDLILILFDAHRLDVSDELMEILKRLKDHQRSIRIVLNKADQVDKAKLRRVYGALMWSLGKAFDNPEVVRVYVGSFWEKPLRHTAHQQLFEADQEALTRELTDLPRLSAVRKINQLIRRTNLVRAHACVLSYLNKQTPWIYGRARRREALLNDLEGVLETVRANHGLDEGDMPDADALRANLQSFDFADFPTLTHAALRQLSDVVDVDIHKVLKEGGGPEKIFKFSKKRDPVRPPGMLARAGSSLRQLFRWSSTGSVSNHAESKNESNSSTTSTGESTSPVVVKTPVSSPASGTTGAVAATPAAATGSSTRDDSTPNEIMPDRVPDVTASANVLAGDGPRQSAVTRTGASLDGSGVSAGGRGGEREGGGEVPDSGVEAKAGSQRVKKGGFRCCSCLQVLVLVSVLMVVLLFLLEPILASMESEEGRSGGGGGLQEILTHQASSAARFVVSTAAGLRRALLDPVGGGFAAFAGIGGGDGSSEEVEAIYRGTVH